VAEYRLTPRAERDLEEIWDYTSAQWSTKQAEKYVAALIDAMERIADKPSLGRSAESVRPGYLRRTVAAHVIFYKRAKYGIVVIRVLHGRMDFKSHVDPE
jgi:toxin ParE1/3/4